MTVEPPSTPGQMLRRLEGLLVTTPVRRLAWVEDRLDREVWVKLESQQRSGSFKFRGAMARLAHTPPDAVVVTASAGNHALAVAEAASVTGHEVVVCLPHNASDVKRRRLSVYDITVVEVGASLDEAVAHAGELSRRRGMTYVSPYNDPLVVTGQGTVAAEFLTQVPGLGTLVVAAGGGGLLAGCAAAVAEAGVPTAMVGCQSRRFHPLAPSRSGARPGRHVPRPTLSDSLVLNADPGAVTLDAVDHEGTSVVVVDEEHQAAAMYALLHNESLLVEGAGAIGLGALLAASPGDLPGTGPVGVVLSGGNLTVDTLARVLTHPFEDGDVRQMLGLQGQSADADAVLRGLSAEPDRQPVTSFEASRRSRLTRRVVASLGVVEDRRTIADLEGLQRTDDEDRLVSSLGAELRRLLSAHDELDRSAPAECSSKAHLLERLERLVLAVAGVAETIPEWQSPSYDQAVAPVFNRVSDLGNPGVNYARYGSHLLVEKEASFLDVMGFDGSRTACLLTSSGMAAYALVEAFLLRFVLESGDRVLLPPYVYFEASEQIERLRHVEVVRTPHHGVDPTLEAVRRTRPRVVFVDPMTNTAALRVTDVGDLLRRLADVVVADTWIVIDGTMLSGAFDPFSFVDSGGPIHVIYYESGSKYLQFGLDMTLVGLVAVPLELRPILARLRRNGGQILTDEKARLLPDATRGEYVDRMARMTENALRIGGRMESSPLRGAVRPVHPGLPSHDDHALTGGYNHLGGLMTFEFLDGGLHQRHLLEAFIEHLLRAAQRHDVPLTKGVSFGFSVPRISAASAMAENHPPFLRLSVGTQDAAATDVTASLVISCLQGFVERHQRSLGVAS